MTEEANADTITKRGRKSKRAHVDLEADAISACWAALESLSDNDARLRVLNYIKDRFGIT